MSHVVDIAVPIDDLLALKKACERCGLEFREGQTTYAWWGRSEGDYPLPEGYTSADLGHCAHAIGIPGEVPQSGSRGNWEIGVCERRDGQPGYTLMFDFYGGPGGRLKAKAGGEECQELMQLYHVEKAKHAAINNGYSNLREERTKSGRIKLYAS